MKSGNLNFLEPSGPLQACNGTALPLPFTNGEVAQGKRANSYIHFVYPGEETYTKYRIFSWIIF